MKAFTLIELFISVIIILILAGLAVFFYEKYIIYSLRTQLVSDLRNCISYILSEKQTNPDKDLSQIVSECSKSTATNRIILQSENPIILKAEGNARVGSIECVYSSTNGSVTCDLPF